MKSSLPVLAMFAAGCLAGHLGQLPGWLTSEQMTTVVLGLLLFFVGTTLGSNPRLGEIVRSLSPRLLLVPLATAAGTLAASAGVGLLLAHRNAVECMAVGSGFAYYSLSSVLITRLAEPSLGAAAAAELGTIALMANIIREISVLIFTPLIVRRFGPLAPICAGGATTMDTTLPVITRYCGTQWVFIAVIHALLLDFSVPFFVSFFCSLL
ncbi:MAG: lysine exporter LysO family protein [Rikenellaceae bacterium]|nr:lysine exporter LysO family protein [Rikenellaceae bacterium]